MLLFYILQSTLCQNPCQWPGKYLQTLGPVSTSLPAALTPVLSAVPAQVAAAAVGIYPICLQQLWLLSSGCSVLSAHYSFFSDGKKSVSLPKWCGREGEPFWITTSFVVCVGGGGLFVCLLVWFVCLFVLMHSWILARSFFQYETSYGLKYICGIQLSCPIILAGWIFCLPSRWQNSEFHWCETNTLTFAEILSVKVFSFLSIFFFFLKVSLGMLQRHRYLWNQICNSVQPLVFLSQGGNNN